MMKKNIWFVLCCFIASVSFTGCTGIGTTVGMAITNQVEAAAERNMNGFSSKLAANIMENVIDSIFLELREQNTQSKQELYIYAADGALLRDIHDLDLIFDFHQNILGKMLSWKTLSAIPTDAQLLYTFTLYQEDLDSPLPEGYRPLVEAALTTLYHNKDDYYITLDFIDVPEWKPLHAIPPKETTNFILQLAESNSAMPETVHHTVPSYNSIAGVSAKQKIEILSPEGKNLLTYTDIDQIVLFVQNQALDLWQPTQAIPTGSTHLCTVIRYGLERHVANPDLVEQYRFLLYQNQDEFYIKMYTSGAGRNVSPEEDMGVYYHISQSIGNYFLNLI